MLQRMLVFINIEDAEGRALWVFHGVLTLLGVA